MRTYATARRVSFQNKRPWKPRFCRNRKRRTAPWREGGRMASVGRTPPGREPFLRGRHFSLALSRKRFLQFWSVPLRVLSVDVNGSFVSPHFCLGTRATLPLSSRKSSRATDDYRKTFGVLEVKMRRRPGQRQKVAERSGAGDPRRPREWTTDRYRKSRRRLHRASVRQVVVAEKRIPASTSGTRQGRSSGPCLQKARDHKCDVRDGERAAGRGRLQRPRDLGRPITVPRRQRPVSSRHRANTVLNF